jgi:membrane protein DedA with SNARE-associated domain
MSVSSVVGYAIGRISSTAAEKLIGASDMASLSCFQQRFGAWTLLALRPVPVLAEASTVMSGVARQPITQVALQLALGNATVSLFYALAGAFFGNGEGTAWWAFLAAMVVTGLFFLAKAVASRLRDGTMVRFCGICHRKRRRRHRSRRAGVLDCAALKI